MYIYCDRPSKSVRMLSKLAKLKIKKSNFDTTHDDIIVNWGCSRAFDDLIGKWLNPPYQVSRVTNKLTFFQNIPYKIPLEIPIPAWSSKQSETHVWLEHGSPVVCRTVLNGHSGNGIVIAKNISELVNATLYTRYIKKNNEWRIHVFNGEVIDIQRKARNLSVQDNLVNWYVRSHKNGFVYVRGDLGEYDNHLIDRLKEVALATIKHFQLDFGAVDIISTERGNVYVLEVNTAPGLEGTTLTKYAEAIRELSR